MPMDLGHIPPVNIEYPSTEKPSQQVDELTRSTRILVERCVRLTLLQGNLPITKLAF